MTKKFALASQCHTFILLPIVFAISLYYKHGRMTLSFDFLSQYALDIMQETQESIFLTGKAGTGKSTLLQHFRQTSKKNIIVLASTGIAAINIGGQTIHSFFRFGKTINIDDIEELSGLHAKLLYEADCIIIDEVSMVRADVMDCIDRTMRLTLDVPAPFGGKQMIFVGDLYQLPPVVTRDEKRAFTQWYSSPYFFASQAYRELMPHVVSLQQVHRQTDDAFVRLLNTVRLGLHNESGLGLLDACVHTKTTQEAIHLTTTNRHAQTINHQKLMELEGEEIIREANVSGKISESMFPNTPCLRFKKGAQIMMLKNSKDGYCNGSLGTIIDFDQETQQVIISIDEETYRVGKHTRQVTRNYYDETVQEIVPDIVGSFTQFPFKLAWAVTIHKSQGLTFENVIIDLQGGAFAQGQTYVALSRARSLQGLCLKNTLTHKDILVDPIVRSYMHTVLWEQTVFLFYTAKEREMLISFLYKDPTQGPTLLHIMPQEIGNLSHQGIDFQGFTGYIVENATQEKTLRPFSYGRVFDVSLVKEQ